MSLNRPWVFIVLALFLLLAFFRGRDAQEEHLHRTRLLMGTVVEIEALGDDKTLLDRAIDEAFDEMARIEGVFSPALPASEISRLNGADTSSELSAELAYVLSVGLEVAQKSGGAFDMTLGALKALWGFDSDTPRLPPSAAIEEALAGIGPLALRIEEGRIVKESPSLRIDMGGIAKGYAVDRAIAVLREFGVTSASVNAGGDIGLLGQRGERPWHVGIRDPRNPEGVIATVKMDGGSIVTSGDYERYFERDGVRYHHLFDPRTGYPASRSRSVTVIAETSVLADALATAVFVLGPSEGISLLEAFPGAEGLVIGPDGSSHLTDGMEERIVWR